MINRCKNFLSNYGDIDVINNYSERLKDVGIYNTPKFLEMFNEYKFIICIENSCSNGYITEKFSIAIMQKQYQYIMVVK